MGKSNDVDNLNITSNEFNTKQIWETSLLMIDTLNVTKTLFIKKNKSFNIIYILLCVYNVRWYMHTYIYILISVLVQIFRVTLGESSAHIAFDGLKLEKSFRLQKQKRTNWCGRALWLKDIRIQILNGEQDIKEKLYTSIGKLKKIKLFFV